MACRRRRTGICHLLSIPESHLRMHPQAAAWAADKFPACSDHAKLFLQLLVVVVAYAIVAARDNIAKRLTRLYERATI